MHDGSNTKSPGPGAAESEAPDPGSSAQEADKKADASARSAQTAGKPSREERLGEALRANLKRRKAQARGRRAGATSPEGSHDEGSA